MISRSAVKTASSAFVIWICSTAGVRGEDTSVSMYLGTAACEQCHDQPTERNRQSGVLERIRLTEAANWRKTDRHANAYANLTKELAGRIGERLGANIFDAKTGCVQCHATCVVEDRWSNIDINAKDALAIEGVGCESCHGPSSAWTLPHQQFPGWHNKPEQEKAALGWNNVRSPIKRAEICASCHIGSQMEGRIVTHEMFAAGHPPLSGFEIESFANKMPVHWRYPYEKKTGTSSFERTQNILVGSVVALRTSIELALADVAHHRWPDFARFDCYACHHDLVDSQWRQRRAPSGPPGRPLLSIGSLPLVKIAAKVAAGPDAAKTIAGLVDRLNAPFEKETFGDPQELAKVGPEIIRWCHRVEGTLSTGPFKTFSAAQATEVLHDLSQTAANDYVDYETAGQLLGAWWIVYEELSQQGALKIDPAAKQQVDQLLAQIRVRDFFQIERLHEGDANQMAENQSIAPRLPAFFKNQASYDPDKFANVMARLDALTRPR